MIQKLTALLLLLAFCRAARAETFTVTSKADSGPGTLREAITKASANGTAEVDHILFNLPGTDRASRTIQLFTELPPLSSNLVIDGTTQNGEKIGVSDAKVILYMHDLQPSLFRFLRFEDAFNIQIYGLFLFQDRFTMFSAFTYVDGLWFKKGRNIVIGKPGKGNYFRGLWHAINSPVQTNAEQGAINSSDITIQSNVFNSTEDGHPYLTYGTGIINPMEFAIQLHNASNITFGGGSQAEGNTVSAQNLHVESHLPTGNGFIDIKNNRFGVRHDGTWLNIGSSSKPHITITTARFSNEFPDYKVSILNNVLHGRITLYRIGEYFRIQGNKIFDYANGGSTNYGPRVSITSCRPKGGLVGGELVEERNEIFTNGQMFYHNRWDNIEAGSIVVYHSPKVSIVKNTTVCSDRYGESIYVWGSNEPYIVIDSTGTNFVRGRATPNCKIEVFLDDDCWACDGKLLLGQTVSNADSSWSFTGTFNGVVIATAMGADSSTSGYTAPNYTGNITLKHPTCGTNNGSITGIILLGSWNNLEWHKIFMRDGNFIDTIVSREKDLLNVGAGSYYFISKLGETCRSPYVAPFTLRDYTPKIDTSHRMTVHPSCGMFNGAIQGLRVNDAEFSVVKWVNSQGTVFPGYRNGPWVSISNLPPGSYQMIVTDTAVGCADSTFFYDLVNQSGPSINVNALQISSASCGQANGSITGITVSNAVAPVFISWVDSLNRPVSSSLDLLNAYPGKYRLKFKDAGGCDTIITPYYIIGNAGHIAIDTANKIVIPSKCSGSTGSISNLTITGGDSYEWRNVSTNTVAGNAMNAQGLPPGTYRLTVTNSMGCAKTSDPVVVPQASFVPIGVTGSSARNASCGINNGSITVNSFNNNASFYTFHWQDGAGQTLGTGTSLSNLGAGTYLLIATDSNGCEKQIFQGAIGTIPPPSFDYGSLQVNPEECGLGQGSIAGMKVNGLAGPSTYTWLDNNGNALGSSIDISGLKAGSYTLKVVDAGICTVVSRVVELPAAARPLPTPLYDMQTILKNNTATLAVKNLQIGRYQFFADPSASLLIQENQSGSFTTPPLTSDQIYYVRFIMGTCQSSLVPVQVKVVDKIAVYVPTAFTPNGDGRNDVLRPVAYGPVKLIQFTVYNRWGQAVFSSAGFNQGWNGTIGGKPAVTGTYIWTLRASNELTGEVWEQKGTTTIIR
jgi:gliding motility-associated-like protein